MGHEEFTVARDEASRVASQGLAAQFVQEDGMDPTHLSQTYEVRQGSQLGRDQSGGLHPRPEIERQLVSQVLIVTMSTL